jgi:hypothetical protein
MKYAPETIKAQIEANISAIITMPSDMLLKAPTSSFRENYGKLRRLAIECLKDEYPDIIQTLPPENVSTSHYTELLAYLKELSAILDQVIEPPSPIF